MFKGDSEGVLKGYLEGDLEVTLGGRLGEGLQRRLQTGLGRGLAVKLRSVKFQVRSGPGLFSKGSNLILLSTELGKLWNKLNCN